MSGVLHDVASWCVGLQLEEVPARVLHRTRCQLLSVLGSVYAGRVLDEAQSVVRALRRSDAGQDATVLATGEKRSPEGAVRANSAMSMAYDYDDYLFMGHTGHSAVLVPLALTEARDASLGDLLACQVVANEVAGRLGASALLGPLNGQMWSFVHLAAGAVASGRLLSLSAEQMAHALAIALAHPPYPAFCGFFGTGAKLLTASIPAVLGMQAAQLAAEGLTGPADPFEGEGGFYDTFCYHPIRGVWTGLGRRWVSETLAVKRHPGCAYVDCALDALACIGEQVRQHGGALLTAENVRAVRVRATLLTCEMERLSERAGGGRLHPVGVNFSVRRSIAWWLIHGGVRAEELTRERVEMQASRIEALVNRVTLEPDPGLNLHLVRSLLRDAGFEALLRELGVRGVLDVLRRAGRRYGIAEHLAPRRVASSARNVAGAIRAVAEWAGRKGRGGGGDRPRPAPKAYSLEDVRTEAIAFPFAARVEVEMQDGTVYRETRLVPEGSPGGPGGDLEQVSVAKFRSSGAGLLPEDRLGEAVTWILLAGPDEPVRRLVPLIAAPAGG